MKKAFEDRAHTAHTKRLGRFGRGSVVAAALLLALGALPFISRSTGAPTALARTDATLPNAVADRVLGQTSLSGATFGNSATTLHGPAAIAIAPAGAPNAGRIFIVDYVNHRVLSWPSATGFATGAAADLVLGQPDFAGNTGGLEAYQLYGPEAAVVDASGNLYVADTENSRVLQFRPPFSNGMNASIVFGQPNFVTPNNQPNQGGSGPAANTLYYPRGLALDATGNLYVADASNHRVVRYSPPFANNMAASLVLGQANFTSGLGNRGVAPGPNTLNDPKGLAMDAAGHLYVAEYSNHRVLRFDPPFSNGQNAGKAFGQPSYTDAEANNGGIGAGTLNAPVDVAVSAAGDVLFITDQQNVRVLGYADPLTTDAEADAVYGQPNFSTAVINNGGVGATSLNLEPLGVAVSAQGGLYVADYRNHRVLAFDATAAPVTPTPTSTSTSTPTSTPTTTPTTPPGQNSTATPTSTPTATPTSVPTSTPPPPATEDGFEADDTCEAAKALVTDGTLQQHTFHKQADADWTRFEVVSGSTYIVQGQVGPGSPADLTLETFTSCAAVPQQQNFAFSPGIRLEFVAAQTGPVFLRWTNANPGIFGNRVGYNLNITARSLTPPEGAVIIVAGRFKAGDPLQPNIHNMTNAVYEAFTRRGYLPANILYMATDLGMTGVMSPPTVSNLQTAITGWARQRLSNNQSLTLYLMDHGDPDVFYLDNTINQRVTPQELDGWLNELEAQFTGLRVNVLIDACYSGSFIAQPNSLSKPGRVVVASTSADRVAYASPTGAIFSDHFVAALASGQSLYDAFTRARWSTQIAYPLQGPQLDDNGDGLVNTSTDGPTAQQRGFSFAGTLDAPNFPPYIQSASVFTTTQDTRREIRATILDDVGVDTAFAVIYPPNYVPPVAQTELAQESLERVLLANVGNTTFSALYSGFTQPGRYRIVIYARDNKGAPAQPQELFVQHGRTVFMPTLVR